MSTILIANDAPTVRETTLTKYISTEIGKIVSIGEKTVEKQRARWMEKLNAQTTNLPIYQLPIRQPTGKSYGAVLFLQGVQHGQHDLNC